MTGERRAENRVFLNLPVRVAGRDADLTAWQAATTTEEVSSSGAAFLLSRPVEVGQILRLSLPMPRELRRFDPVEPTYRVYADVRHVVPRGASARVGVVFLGKEPPEGLDLAIAPQPRRVEGERPEGGPSLREHPRYEVFLIVRIRRTDPWTGQVQEELTSTDDVGLGGARVKTTLSIDKGELIDLEETEGGFWTRAEVKNVTIGPDNLPRLNLRFLRAPDAVAVFLQRLGISTSG